MGIRHDCLPGVVSRAENDMQKGEIKGLQRWEINPYANGDGPHSRFAKIEA